MPITVLCQCDRCADTKTAYESSNYPMPVGWSKFDVSLRGNHKNDVKVETLYLCEECFAIGMRCLRGQPALV